MDNIRKLIKSLIFESIFEIKLKKESEDEDHQRPEDNDKIDPDIEGDPYTGNDVRSGSDIEGIKKGGTGFTHGFGYPNFQLRRGRKLNRKDLEKILFITYIHGVPEATQIEFGRNVQRLTHDFIKQNFPWIFNFSVYSDYKRGMDFPFLSYFGNVGDDFTTYWLDSFRSEVQRRLEWQKHWQNISPKELQQAYQTKNHHVITSYRENRTMLKKYPTMIPDFEKLLSFLDKLQNDHAPISAFNPTAYPAFVSLYDTTRRLGGNEEGGWWYDNSELVDSTPVKSYKEVRLAAVHYLRTLGESDLNGKPMIILEKEKGSQTKDPPSYS
jgi:hypothetical protein